MRMIVTYAVITVEGLPGRGSVIYWLPQDAGYALIARTEYLDARWIVPGTWRELEDTP